MFLKPKRNFAQRSQELQPSPTLAGLQLGVHPTHHRGLPVSCCSLYPHVLPSISRRSVRLPSPLASPDVSAFPTITDGVDLRIAVSGSAQRSLLVAARMFAKPPKGGPLHRRL